MIKSQLKKNLESENACKFHKEMANSTLNQTILIRKTQMEFSWKIYFLYIYIFFPYKNK